jgi:hypothetical protein
VNGGTSHLLLSWFLPPACGALVGFLFGRLVFPWITRALILRSRERITHAVAERSDSFASGILAMRAASVVPAPGSPSSRKLEETFAGMLTTILGSRGTIYGVRDAVGKLVAGLSAQAVGDTARKLGIERLLSEKILGALGAERSRAAISAAAGKLVAERAGTAVDDEVIREISKVVDSAIPEAAEAVVRWLHSAETRTYLSERGRELLPRILEKLTDWQKLFLSAAQLDRRLSEKMPEIVDETVLALEKMVREPRQQERVVAVFSDAARGWRDSLLVSPVAAGLALNERQQKLADSISRLVDRFLARLEDPAERAALAARADARLDEDRRSLGAFVRDSLGLGELDIVEMISDRVLRVLTSPQTAKSLGAHLVGLIISRANEQPDATVGSALGIDDLRRQELEGMLHSAVPGVMERALPQVLDAPETRRGVGGLLGALGAAAGLLAGVALSVLRVIGVL